MTQFLQSLPTTSAVVHCPDSANLSITDNLDLRVRVALDKWDTGDEQTFVCKREGDNEWNFRTNFANGRLELVWYDTGGVANVETASTDHGFVDGTTHWIRARRSGTSVNFWTSDTDTNDHTAVTWTALGTTQTTPSGSIRSTVGTHITVGTIGLGGGEVATGIFHAVAIVDNVTTRAAPVFADAAQWSVGDDHPDTNTDPQGNTWTLGQGGKIVGDNVEGAAVAVLVGFATNPFSGAQNWTDITDDVRAISTNRGRNAELDRFDAGTATFEIDNTSGWYHSHNTASPYYPNVRPMVPIRVRAVHDGTIYPIWAGFVERWPVNFPGNIESIATVDAVDLFKPLSLADASLEDRGALVTALTPVAWWRFNDDTDSSAAGTHDLTITGASTGDPGVWTNDFAGAFDGVADFASVANEADVELRADMSIEMWFRPELSTVGTTEVFNTDDTWICPAGVTAVDVEVWGGGGGGPGGDAGALSGDGGGAGGYARKIVPVVAGTSYTIEVGTGGAGNSGTGPAGDGGSSWFGASLVRATGGGGGQMLGIGGTAGQGTVGSIKVAGGRGGKGIRYNTFGGINAAGGGGGGGAGSRTGNGQAGRSMDQNLGGGLGGQGGGTGGDGGNGGLPTLTNGQNGSAPGGGAGGGAASNVSDTSGGNGAAGRVRLVYVTTEAQTPFSVTGSATHLYRFHWDGHLLKFGPASSSSVTYTIGEAESDLWHHVVVTVDWSSGSRIIRGYLNGVLTLTASTGYEPPVEARTVAVGRRAISNDQYFKGDMSEIVIYNTILSGQDVTNLYAAQLEGFETQLTGARVEYVLGTAEVGVGIALTDFNLDAGQTIISGPNSPTEVTALEAIQIAADTEFGSFFIAADGTPTFQERHHRLVDMALPLATLDETDYETLHLLGKDDLKVANDVRVAPSDSTEPFIVQDATSKGTYGRRTLELTVYPDNPNDAYDMATWLLALFKEPKDDIASIPFRLYEEVTDFPTLLAAELGDRYTIDAPLEGDDLAVDVYLERISHNIDQVSWTMDWGVTPAGESETFWLLGVAGFSELGETTVLGF